MMIFLESKEGKMGNNDGKNEIKVKQVNPKLRLFLLIFSY